MDAQQDLTGSRLWTAHHLQLQRLIGMVKHHGAHDTPPLHRTARISSDKVGSMITRSSG
jgi:hypothetical protein